MLMASCNSTYSNMEYYLSGKEATKNKTWLNFDIEKESYINGRRDYKVCYNVFMHYDNEKPYYIVNDSTTMTLFMVSPKRVEIANSQNQELTCFMNRRDEKSRYYDFFKAQIYTTVFEFIPYYFAGFPPSLGINRLIVNDVMTIQSGQGTQKCYTGQLPTQYIKNHITGSFDIPLQYECKTWIDQESLQIDSVIAYNTSNNTFDESITFRIKNINTDDKTIFFDSAFNSDSPKYRGFSRHNEFNIPYSLRGTHVDTIGADLLCFPIVNLNGDTTCIKNENCFILLNFWSINCPPCLSNLQRYKTETDSLGYRIIEKEGIKIMAINYLSNNMNKIGEIATKTSTCDIVYSAKGIRQFISIPYLGYYYLVSPSNEILLSSIDCDYDKILKAKYEYERNSKH